jgi:hypothetical protein
VVHHAAAEHDGDNEQKEQVASGAAVVAVCDLAQQNGKLVIDHPVRRSHQQQAGRQGQNAIEDRLPIRLLNGLHGSGRRWNGHGMQVEP